MGLTPLNAKKAFSNIRQPGGLIPNLGPPTMLPIFVVECVIPPLNSLPETVISYLYCSACEKGAARVLA